MAGELRLEDVGLEVRRVVDRWVGVSPRAVHARTSACLVGLAVALRIPDAHSAPLRLLSFVVLLMAFGIAPGIAAAERVYGKWPVLIGFSVALLMVPLAFAGAFTHLFFDPDQKPSSKPFFLLVAAISWFGVFWMARTAWRYAVRGRA